MLRAVLPCLALVAAGCVMPEAELLARRGDVVLLTIGAWDGDRLVWGTVPAGTPAGGPLPSGSAGWFVMAPIPPATVPADAVAPVATLPPGIVEALVGRPEGHETSVTLTPALGYGERNAANVVTVPRNDTLARIVVVAPTAVPWARAAGDRGPVEAYGAPGAWAAVVLEAAPGPVTLRLSPPDPDWNGTVRLDAPDHCVPERCLFRSTMTGVEGDALLVRHEPVLGSQSESLGVAARVAAVDADQVTIDYNHPLAGRTLLVPMRLERIVAPAGPDVWRAPPLEARILDGTAFALDDALGTPVLLEFFAPWCPSCVVNARERIPSLLSTHGDTVRVVSVNVDPFATTGHVKRFADEHGITWPVVPDGSRFAAAYRVGTLSTDVLVGPDGVVEHVGTGELDVDAVRERLDTLASGGAGP